MVSSLFFVAIVVYRRNPENFLYNIRKPES
jgi:hypothetical protein